MINKGIILAGGYGTRMSPLTKAINKQLLPIYDKPLIFYPLSILMLSGIRNILIIVNKGQLDQFKKILPNGTNLGIKINYSEQQYPRGLPDAFLIGENFIGKSNIALILGDNFFYGQSLTKKLRECVKLNKGATVILHPVSNPSSYGVANINATHHYEDADEYEVDSTASGATAITNFIYEETLNDAKRNLTVIRPEYVNNVVNEFKKLLK